MLLRALFIVVGLVGAVRADPPLPKEVTTIAFGSCLRQDKPAPILEKVADAKPDLFIWLGDNIYGDSDDPAVIKAKYEKLGQIEGFKKIRAQTPFLYVWDDHDYGKNDAGAEYAFKEQNKQLMLDFFGEPKDSPRRKRDGNYDSVIIGSEGKRVQVVLLDTRWFRSPLKSEMRDGVKWNIPNNDADAAVLGEAQWKWLEDELKKPAEVRIVCSSIQVFPTAHRFEKWGNFPKERERLLKLLQASRVNLILSGDRHWGSIMSSPIAELRPCFEVTGSALNQPGNPSPEELSPDLRSLAESNFGLVRIEFQAKPSDAPLIVGTLHDISGKARLQYESNSVPAGN